MKCRFCGYSKNFNSLIKLENFPKAAQFFLRKKDFGKDKNVTLRVVQCPSCELVQLENKPVSYYKNVITASSLNEESKKEIVREFNTIIKKFKLEKSKTLEIGSAKGDFLNAISKCNIKAIGLENSQKNINSSKNKVKIVKGYLLDKPKLNNKFDFIICNNFLEHQPKIKDFLEKINSMLFDNGHIYFSVPSLKRIIEKSCLYEFVTDHLVYFTKNTLTRVFENSGFEVLDCYYKNNENDIVLIGKKRNLLSLDNENKEMSIILSSIKKKVKKFKKYNKSISVWGAGHRALAAMSLAKLKEIDFVVDSAPFKQGLYTPILHKEIISPEDFLKKKCDILIIMLPGNYTHQVKKYLKNMRFSGKIIAFEDEVIN
ncbi:class I SAM-dependent methyltransferase [Rickettsiales bacterium]|nr:class I SAM-dependent methyltransferase [Rickettsiales bacterium]